MNPQLALIVFGIASACLLFRARAQMVKPRAFTGSARKLPPSLPGETSGEPSKATSDSFNTRRRTGTLIGGRGVLNQRRRGIALRPTGDGLSAVSRRTVALRVPHWLRRWIRSDFVSIKVGHLVIGALVLLLVPSLGPALLLFALGLTRVRRRRMIEQLRATRSEALPDLVDMIRLCVASGCTPYGAIVVLGSLPLRADDVLAPLINEAARELERGAVVGEVLDQFQAEVGEAARPLCSALRSSAELGTPIAETLDLLAREARRARKAQADVAAKRLPVLLLFPLITCILPAFALLAIVPLLGGALSALHW